MEKYPISEAEEQVVSCIDRGLERIGPNVRYLVYWHLQNIGHIKRTEIALNPEHFAAAIRGLYRESAPAVERAIIQELNLGFGLNYYPNQLIDAINDARQKSEQMKVI